MASLSLVECCRLLAVDPKTLRLWLAQAQMVLHADPTNAKIKCVTSEQVETLARLHGRMLHQDAGASAASPLPFEAQSQISPMALSDADLRTRLTQMETHIATLQAQLTDLALQLLCEREQRTEQRLLALEAERPSGDHPSMPFSGAPPSAPCQPVLPALVCHPTERPNRLIPLIEYGARGQYVLISPEEGELAITPDSPEWFAWLASLTSFRFLGQQGRLSASRNRGRPCWMAYRRIHGRCYSYGLGNTKRLTIAHLEHMAATLQSHVPSL